MSIESIGAIQPFSNMVATGSTSMEGVPVDNRFLELLVDEIRNTNQSIGRSNDLFSAYLAGEEIATHEVMIAMSKAKVELQLMVEIRNKVLESYQEITRIQL